MSPSIGSSGCLDSIFSVSASEKKEVKQRFSMNLSEAQLKQAALSASVVATISSSARLRAGESVVVRGGFSQESVCRISKRDDASLREFLELMVYERGSEMVNLSEEMAGTGPVRYSCSGEPVTQESSAYFKSAWDDYQAKMISIYTTETQKGTDLREIYQKLADLTAQQPERLLGMIGYTTEFV